MTTPKIEKERVLSTWRPVEASTAETHRAPRRNRKPVVLTPEKVPSPSISRAA